MIAAVGFAAAPVAAHADTIGPNPGPDVLNASVIVPNLGGPLPYCAGAGDSLGNSGTLCINSVTVTPVAGETGDTVTATGTLTVCVLGGCTVRPIAVGATGAGLNLSDLVPAIVQTGVTTVTIPDRVCVGAIACTPGAVNVPSYTVTLFPNPPLGTVCVNGICQNTPILAPIVLTSGDVSVTTPVWFVS